MSYPSWRALAPPILVLGALASTGCHHTAREPPVRVPPGQVWLTPGQVGQMGLQIVPATDQDVDDTILSSGRVAFDDSRVSHVFSPVSGRVTHIEAHLGQRVEVGAPLVVLQAPDVGSASSDLSKAEADAIAAQHDLQRQREMYAQHASSQRDVEHAEDEYRRNVAELERAREHVRLFRQGSYDRVSQTYTIRAEIAGEVVARNVTPGIEVQGQYAGGTPLKLFTIGDGRCVWVLADVYEMDLARVHLGAPASISVVAYPGRVFRTTVDWISGTLDPTTRTARVRCVLENPDAVLRPEMYATVELRVDQQRALAIPRSALLRLGDQTVVFVDRGRAPDGRRSFERAPVQVDEGEGGRWLVVQHGLEAGTPVVVAGAIQLLGLL